VNFRQKEKTKNRQTLSNYPTFLVELQENSPLNSILSQWFKLTTCFLMNIMAIALAKIIVRQANWLSRTKIKNAVKRLFDPFWHAQRRDFV
jgi:hypothetical protein